MNIQQLASVYKKLCRFADVNIIEENDHYTIGIYHLTKTKNGVLLSDLREIAEMLNIDLLDVYENEYTQYVEVRL